jgi:hypothetical protein
VQLPPQSRPKKNPIGNIRRFAVGTVIKVAVLLGRRIDALIRESVDSVGKGGPNPYEVGILLLDFVIERLTDLSDVVRDSK